MNILASGKAVRIDNQYLHVELADGRIISTPLDWYQELLTADERDRFNYHFICGATGIEWPALDYHLSIESMLIGVHHQIAA
ncbi:DUF2442 domain-containing protein [Methylomonas sp. LL1]|uniref:DUF2442 domain-containing protein n=1 Tax=Methylomonas sp. LL1 TaxID=2785785 RepID=UPI0018C3C493|nr:DUF2442 domain-containing protein [Methylomonas sp. LL1]QPK63014.1 DUF2442 domain-containing protein [Methylomonas sp. LL1]